MPEIQKKVLGTLIGTLIGSLGGLLLPRQNRLHDRLHEQTQNWGQKALALSEYLYRMRKPGQNDTAKTFMAGAVMGAIIGAGSTLFIAPKSGKQLRKQVSNTYQDVAQKTQDLLDYWSNICHPGPTEKKAKALKSVARTVRRRRRRKNTTPRRHTAS